MDVKSPKIWLAFGLSKMRISMSYSEWAQGRFQILKRWFLFRRSNNLKSFLSYIRRHNRYYNNNYEWCYNEYSSILSRFVHAERWSPNSSVIITVHHWYWSMQTIVHQELQISPYSTVTRNPLEFEEWYISIINIFQEWSQRIWNGPTGPISLSIIAKRTHVSLLLYFSLSPGTIIYQTSWISGNVIMTSCQLFQRKKPVSSSGNIQWTGEATENCDRCWCNQLEWNHGYRTWRAEISMFSNWYRLWICDWFLRKYWWACILWVIMDDSFYFKALKTGNKRWIWFQKYGFRIR